jgi:hypothetical protein
MRWFKLVCKTLSHVENEYFEPKDKEWKMDLKKIG